MHIALFSDNFYPELGGIQDSVLILGRSLALRGHTVTFCVPSFSATDCACAGLPYKELETGPRIRIIRYASMHIPSPTQQSRLVIPTFRRWKALREAKIDIIHTQTFLGVGLEALAAAKHLNVPLVGTNHWAIAAFDEFLPFGRKTFHCLSLKTVNWYYNKCAYVTAPSQNLITEMEMNGLRAPHCLLSNPINTEAFTAVSADRAALRKKFGLTGGTMVYAGRLAIEKNIHVAIRALAHLKKRVPDAQFAVAGHGSYGPTLKKLAEELGVGDSVIFTGTLPVQELAELFRASDVFAIASTTETQSMTLLQAMSCGLPAVGVDSRALPEYIQHGRHGFVVPPGDAEAFAVCAEKLLTDGATRKIFGDNGARWVQSNFSVASVTDRAEKIYRDLLQ